MYTKIWVFCILLNMDTSYTIPKKLVAVHDISAFGRSSLGVVIPTLSTMGVAVSALPGALLSTQTDGFQDYYYKDLTKDMNSVIAHWATLNLSFSSIYSGFLASELQVDSVLKLHSMYPDSLKVVDPVMGDHGELYGPMSSNFHVAMEKLVAQADLITPNMTEASILLQEPFPKTVDNPDWWVRRLQSMGPKKVVITSVPLKGREGECCTVYADGDSPVSVSSVPYIDISLPGTGDIFTSVLTGFLLRGLSLSPSVEQAVDFVHHLIQATVAAKTPRNEGPLLESQLWRLTQPNF